MGTVKKIISWVGVVFFALFGIAFIANIEEGSVLAPFILAVISFGFALLFLKFALKKPNKIAKVKNAHNTKFENSSSKVNVVKDPSKKQIAIMKKEEDLKKAEADKIEAKRIEEENKRILLEEKRRPFIELQESLTNVPITINKSDVTVIKNNASIPEIKTTLIRTSSTRASFGDYIVVDVETTGLSSRRDEIIEIAAVKFLDFEPVEYMATFVKPKKPISDEITEINGINNEHVADAPKIHEVKDSFIEFISDMPVVAHNLSFDFKFLHVNNIDLTQRKRRYFDTLELSQKALKKYDDYKAERAYDKDQDYDYDVFDHKLDTLCEYYGIYRPVSHRSVSDCIAAGLIFRNLVFDKLDE